MGDNLIKKGLAVVVIFLFIGMCVVPSTGTISKQSSKPISTGDTLYVGGEGPNNYTRIQDAVDDAVDGDTIFVYDDSSPYLENIIVNKRIDLIGEDKDTTIIEGVNGGNIIEVTADETTITSFTIQNGLSGIHISSTSNNEIIGNIITDTVQAIIIEDDSSYNIISDNYLIFNLEFGIYLDQNSHHNSILNNVLSNFIVGTYGICLDYSKDNKISNNMIVNGYCEIGIVVLEGSDYNVITKNTVNDNNNGITLAYASDHNIISSNNITNNDETGIAIFEMSINNRIYHNNFIDNTQNAYDECSPNNWDFDYPTGGNYWDDYTDVDNDGDGIGDTPYSIPGGTSQDNYPLMEQYNGENYPPNKPVIDGAMSGTAGEEYDYIFIAQDSEFDEIYYYIEWGDGEFEDWFGPFTSGEEIIMSHTWHEEDTYTIRAKAKDIFDAESEWGTLEVTMPVNQPVEYPLLELFRERFPLLYQLFIRVLEELNI